MEILTSTNFSVYVQKLIKRHHVVGLAIAVVQDGKVASKGFGKASLEPPRDFTPDTLIYVGSAAKSLTAATVGLLVADNEKYPKVQYKTHMASLLPDDFVMGKDHADVTVEDVLCHRTGMPPHEFSLFGTKAKQPSDLRSITRNLRNLSPAAPNREQFIYCNMMYTVATHLVEHTTEGTFSDFLEENILQPLHMDSTALFLKRAQAKGLGGRIATGYQRDRVTNQFNAVQQSHSPEAQGSGQIISSANDYAKWIRATLNREGPITEDMFSGLTTRRIQQDPPTEDLDDDQISYYALGWEVRHYGGYTLVSHYGGESGYQCNHFFIPELKFGGAIFSNSDNADSLVSILTYLLIDKVVHASRNGNSLQMNGYDSGSDSRSDSDDEESDYDENAEMQEELLRQYCPSVYEPQPQDIPLSAYTGQYWNSGYRGINIQEKHGSLFVDATDRSLGFTLTFKHVCQQTKYIAHLSMDLGDNDHPVKAEFVFKEDGAVKVGLQLEDRLEGYIWFEKVEE